MDIKIYDKIDMSRQWWEGFGDGLSVMGTIAILTGIFIWIYW